MNASTAMPDRSGARATVAVVLAVWFAAVYLLGTHGSFVQPAGTPPLAILLGATLPLAVFAIAWRASAAFRALVLGADLRLLAAIQAWRAGGLGFLALQAHGVLPALFAWPAGLGDIAIGITAPWIVLALMRDARFVGHRAFVAWNVLGIVDLVVAVGAGALASGFIAALAGNVTTVAMAELPLVLIPAYLVPLFVMLHIAALLQSRRAARAPGAALSRR